MTADFLSEEVKKFFPWTTEALSKGQLSLSAGNFVASAETFFSLPEILREEALFLAMDILGAAEKAADILARPRRETLRSFIRSKNTASDLGQYRLEHKNGQVTVCKTDTSPFNAGFSVLIKSPGVYKLEELTITVVESMQLADSSKTLFFSGIPLVLRSIEDGKILAEDRQGKAAIIQAGNVVWKRKVLQENGNNSFSIQLKGGSF